MEISRLPRRVRDRALARIAAEEFRRCGEDILYWLDESRHPGVPYVFTHDKRQQYVCSLCVAQDPSKREWQYGRFGSGGQSPMQKHVTLAHSDLGLTTDEEVKSIFEPLPWTRPFPLKPYMPPIFKVLTQERLVAIEKSRDMIATWLMSAYVTWDALFHPGHQNIMQSKTAPFTYELVHDRAYFIWRHHPPWFKRLMPAEISKGEWKSGIMTLGHGSEILGFPQGGDQIRQLHPNIVFIDEAAYQEACQDAVGACRPAIQEGGQLILNSSANPSFFQILVEDRTHEES